MIVALPGLFSYLLYCLRVIIIAGNGPYFLIIYSFFGDKHKNQIPQLMVLEFYG